MKSEKKNLIQSNSKKDLSTKPYKAQWNWILTGIFLIVFGLLLPIFATSYYSDYREHPKPIISFTPILINNTNTDTNINSNNANSNKEMTREDFDKDKAKYEVEAKEAKDTVGQGTNDLWLWTKTRAALASINELRNSEIIVNVENDVVTLKGMVNSAAQKDEAIKAAKSIDGVKQVKDNLKVDAKDSMTNRTVNSKTSKANLNINTSSNLNPNKNSINNSNDINNSSSQISLNQNIKNGSDRLKYDYPKYFLEKEREYEVNLYLDYVTGEVIATTTTTNVNKVTTNFSTNKIKIIPSADPNFDIWIDANLTSAENLQEPKKVLGGSQKYLKQFEQKPLHWKWNIKLAETAKDQEKVECKLQLNYGYRLKYSNETAPIFQQKFMDTVNLTGQVGLPFLVWLLTYLSVPSGALLSFFGFAVKKPTEEKPNLIFFNNQTDEGDEVYCTLYAPTEAKAGNDFIVQVFAHLAEQAEILAEIAAMTDENLKKQAYKELDQPIKLGSVLTFQISMSGMEIDDPIQNYKWNGKVIDVPFIISVPKDHEPIVKFGKVVVSENNVPIGRLTFKVSIVGNIQTLKAEDKSLSEETFKRYQYAFISYASENRPEVLERVQMLEAARIKYFQDVLNLDPGERWEKALYKHIDESDVVFLFWSKAASESKWVEKEILYALERQQGKDTAPPDIIPIIIEGPPPIKPPTSLNFLHFNDKFMYFIYAAEAEHKLKRARK